MPSPQWNHRLEDPLQLSAICAASDLSPRHLQRLCLEQLGETPSDFYRALRLKHARNLLLHGSELILGVATACGFVSASHFSRRYRQLFGASPQRRPPPPAGRPNASERHEGKCMNIDHLIWFAPDLAAAERYFAQRMDAAPAFGGVHSGEGTCNSLLSLGDASVWRFWPAIRTSRHRTAAVSCAIWRTRASIIGR